MESWLLCLKPLMNFLLRILEFSVYVSETIKSPLMLAEHMANKARLLQGISENRLSASAVPGKLESILEAGGSRRWTAAFTFAGIDNRRTISSYPIRKMATILSPGKLQPKTGICMTHQVDW